MNANKDHHVLDERVRGYYAAQRLPDARVVRILSSAASAETPRLIRWRQPQWLAAAAALLVLLGGAMLWRTTPTYAAGRVAAEVAQTHLKAYTAEVHGDCFDRVGEGLEAIHFPLKPTPNAPLPEGLTVIGGRYCTVRGKPAAQILLEDADGRRCTLIVALADDSRLANVRHGEYKRHGVHVRIWHDAGRIFVMAV